ncbi:HNH endonuclease [Octadecabacter sp. R77987]|uniref:HNH endonuclease n=1 Tax=Octadecabacter sp. R77987 TaxID=3093874 RepID=UPI0036712AE5
MMWAGNDPTQFARKHGLTQNQAKRRLVTAEHLWARCDGGRDIRRNIAAACLHCNTSRHRPRSPLSPNDYRKFVAEKIATGGWGH